MNKYLIIILLTLNSCKAQNDFNSTIEFTSDLEKFGNLSGLKETLKDVEIIALGENTHGLGGVFKAKSDLVKFLHQELGFNLVLFESGFGDGALAWEKLDSLSPLEFTNSFTSNYYYHSEEIKDLMEYVKSQNKRLVIQGFDCQPQQDYLLKRMTEIIQPIDPVFAESVGSKMRSFNKLYQFENDKDSINFYKQRDLFISFLSDYEKILDEKEQLLLNLGTTKNEIHAIKKSNQIFKDTYSKIEFGNMMSWPISANIRDKSLFETVKWFKEKKAKTKIIIWAQNSHIENKSKPNYNVNWMGHSLKNTYGNKYYSIGAIVYSGKNLNYNGTFDFEHNKPDYLAYHLNRFQKEEFILDLRNYNKNDFLRKKLLGMESNGNTAEFIAKDRFDGLLFIKYSDIPKLIVNSPGKPLPAITMEELNSFEAPSLSRNPILTYVFSLMDYVEEKGFGMATFKSMKEKFNLPIPHYTFKSPFLSLTFTRNVESIKEVIKIKTIQELSRKELVSFEIFRRNKPVSKSEFVEYSDLAKRTAERLLKRFVDLELIKIVGSGRSTKYIVNE